MALMADIFNKTLVLADGTVLDCFDPDLLNLKDGSGCGTGAGGFKPGNTCARGGAGIEEVDLHPALKKLKVSQDRIYEMEDHIKEVIDNNLDASSPAAVAEHTKALNQQLKELMAKSNPHIRVTEDVLQNILDDGRFKNQFETGSSKGMFDPKIRLKVEHRDMGVPLDLDPQERPIYGYLSDKPQDHSSAALDNYGTVVVELHASVKDRSTVTLQDSLQGAVATPVNNPSMLSLSENDFGLPIQIEKGSTDTWPYTELQVHGGLPVSDIKKVLLRKPAIRRAIINPRDEWRQAEWDKFDQQREALLKKLEAAGIAWELY